MEPARPFSGRFYSTQVLEAVHGEQGVRLLRLPAVQPAPDWGGSVFACRLAPVVLAAVLSLREPAGSWAWTLGWFLGLTLSGDSRTAA